MLKGAGRHRLTGNGFSKRPNLGEPVTANSVGHRKLMAEVAYEGAANVPDGTLTRSFAKPSNVGLQIGLVPTDPHMVIILAREIYDNDAIAGAVVDTMARIPFGSFSLSGLPDKETAKPYEISLDRVRSKSLMPVLASTHLVDGAFLGGGLFDEHDKVWNSIIPYDILHSTITPAPVFGATPIVDVQLQQDAVRTFRGTDERMQRYRKYLPDKFMTGGVIRLPLENTFYIPNGTLSHVSLGTSLYRKIMIVYLLEKALARGTVEMAYRRQRPMLHIQAGDENWDASVAEMQYLSDLFMAADLDPLGAVVVTRPGVNPQEVGGLGELWKWTDNIDVLTSLKLKGLGMPDGLLGGDVALDSVSATLTVFIDMVRQFRERITRLFFYEKFFPYIAIANGHRKDRFNGFQAHGFMSRAADVDIDMEDYFTPSISWHNSMRPEGDREYMEMLDQMRQAGVPIPIRVLTAAGGLDIHDILNSAPDDLANRAKIAEINAQIAAMDQAAEGGQGGGGDNEQFASARMYDELAPFKRKGIMNREYDDRIGERNRINGHSYVMTARERRRREDRMNRLIARAAADIAKKLNREKPRLVKPTSRSLIRAR